MIYPDNPRHISVDMLQRLDDETPGTWIAQPKYDGWRRVLVREDGGWISYSKHKKGETTKPLPMSLYDALVRTGFPSGTVLDAEWMGPRLAEQFTNHTPWMGVKNKAGDNHYLVLFDLLGVAVPGGTEYGRDITFAERYEILHQMFYTQATKPMSPNIRLAPIRKNPGLVDFFQEQLSDPLSEGIVVRKAKSGLLLGETKCQDNPAWFKVKYRDIKEEIT